MSDTMDIGGFDGSVSAVDQSGFGNSGNANSGGLDASGSGISAVDLSGSSPGPNLETIAAAVSAAASASYAMATSSPLLAAVALSIATYSLGQQAVVGMQSVLSPDPSIAAMQMNWSFAGPQ